jgi:hypothetical protein
LARSLIRAYLIMTKKPKIETCILCKRVGDHAKHCQNRQCVSCGLIGGKHNDDCFIIRDAIKPARLEVNGEAARIIRSRDIANAPTFGPVKIKVEWVQRLQEQFDVGKITIPGVTSDDHCRVKESRPYKGGAVEVNCPHRAVLRETEKTTCNACNSHKTSTIIYLCLLHAITHHGNGAPIADMGPLFVDPEAVAESAEEKQ